MPFAKIDGFDLRIIFTMSDPDEVFACTIAGSDSGGAAGLQGDLLTFAALGVWGLSVVTAITAQNSHECLGVWEAPAGVVALQIRTLLRDFDIKAFKTGMLYNSRIIREVDSEIPDTAAIIVDPVMVATCGHRLLVAPAIDDLVSVIIPRSTVVTPNLPEAATLSGIGDIHSVDGMRQAGEAILDMGAKYVVIKGGHIGQGPASDLLMGREGEWILTGPRYPGQVHGTGCCFAAAITGYIARGIPVPDACRAAKDFVSRAICHAAMSQSGHRMVRSFCARHNGH